MRHTAFDRDWSTGPLLRFALPSIAMMIFMGLYTVVDAVFVAQFVDTDGLAAINIVCPVLNLTVGLGTMVAAGGNAVISREMGAGNYRQAREDLTLLIIAGGVIGTLITLGGTLGIRRVICLLGANGRLFPYCREYLSVLLWFIPANLLQTLFSNLFVTAGRPGLGLGLSIVSGTANIILDYLFIVPCGLGIRGAALGTGFGYLIPAATGLFYFAEQRGPLYFARPKWKGSVLWESCLNGSSEMVSQLASAVTTFLFNRSMMELLGEHGVAAITIIVYSQFLLHTLYIGFSLGVAPVIGFHHGKQGHTQLKKILSASLRFISAASLIIFTLSRLGGPYIVGLFAGRASAVYPIAAEGFGIFSFSFLFCGLNIFTSALFTALSNGKISAILSLLRTFGLTAGFICLLPHIWGLPGVWLAVPLAEGLTFLVSLFCLVHFLKTETD